MTVVIAVRYDNITIIMLHCNIMVIIFKDSCIVISHVFLISYTNNDIGVRCKYRADIDIGVWTIVDNEHDIRVRKHSCEQVLISIESVKFAIFYRVNLSLGGLQQSLMMLTPPATERVTKILCKRTCDVCKF